MDKPDIFFGFDQIIFDFFGEKVVVDKVTSKVFLNGEEQSGFRKYHSPFVLENNERLRKTRLIDLRLKGKTFVVNRGSDGRLFFLFWDNPES